MATEAKILENNSERIGDMLVKEGLITADQLAVVLHEKLQSDKMLGEILVDFGFLTEDALSSILAENEGLGRFKPHEAVFDIEILKKLPKTEALQHKIILLDYDLSAKIANVVMADPYDVLALDMLRRYLPKGFELRPLLATPADITAAIDRFYGYEMSIDGILAEMSGADIDVEDADISIIEGSYSHPVIRLCNAILLDAVKLGASDIHFEPEEMFLRLRYRIDGVMQHIRAFHKDYWAGISHRLKILANMNIADRLNPQDGRFSMMLGNREVDFRAATMPTLHGENIVLRVLDKTHSLRSLENLGYSKDNLEALKIALKRPEGIIIVTGPTGSGKTTTLYAMLDYLATPELNIMTLEDPVEYMLPAIRQTQIRDAAGLGFSDAVRSILRQDPDVIFIGEVRDAETAQMALRAAMTGHQLFTTLHTNDAVGVIPRLLDLGLNPSLLSGNITAVLAQRLARTLCTSCKKSKIANEDEKKLLGDDSDDELIIYEAVGCDDCRGTGYNGRIALVELLLVDEVLDEVISNNGTRTDLLHAAEMKGFKTIALDGIEKVKKGLISIDSLVRSSDLTSRMSVAEDDNLASDDGEG